MLDDVKELLNNQAMEIQEFKKMHAKKEENGRTKEMVDTMGDSEVGGPNQGGGRRPG